MNKTSRREPSHRGASHPRDQGPLALPGRAHDGLPEIVRKRAKQEGFNPAATADLVPDEAGGADSRAVDDHDIPGREQAWKIREAVINQIIDIEEAGGVAGLDWTLGNGLDRQLIEEV